MAASQKIIVAIDPKAENILATLADRLADIKSELNRLLGIAGDCQEIVQALDRCAVQLNDAAEKSVELFKNSVVVTSPLA